MQDDEDSELEHKSDGECYCPSCIAFSRKANAITAANMRRGVWTDVFMERVKLNDTVPQAAKYASQAVAEMDKAFPEVKTAAMKEDR